MLLSMLIRNFLISYQQSSSIEKANPGMPSKKKSKGLPPNTLLTPGTYSKKMKSTVSARIPKNMCLLKPE